jgi:hypothetical protein
MCQQVFIKIQSASYFTEICSAILEMLHPDTHDEANRRTFSATFVPHHNLACYKYEYLSQVPSYLGCSFVLIVSRCCFPCPPPIQLVPGSLFPDIKRQAREAEHSPLSSAEVKNCGANFHSTTCLHGTVLKYMLSQRIALSLPFEASIC